MKRSRSRSRSPIHLWTIPSKYSNLSDSVLQTKREKRGILAVGSDIPPLIKSFKKMRFPAEVRKGLKKLHIRKPTNLQMQALPIVLSSRNTAIISLESAGKSFIFLLPLIMAAFEEEERLALLGGEGPIGLIIVPSRELAQQLYRKLDDLLYHLRKMPPIRVFLCIGGIDMKEQLEAMRRGVHIIISTPGRLADLLNKKKISLSLCKFFVLDEADRLLDLGFEEEIINLYTRLTVFFTQRPAQVILTSATIPKKLPEFARVAMHNPIYLTLSKANLSKLRVSQEIELVNENKKSKLLECLQKTAPPILIFCENKNDVDDLFNHLSQLGMGVIQLHGGKSQEERYRAIQLFRRKDKEILIATDVAAKGLDFSSIKHVINYDAPKDLEGYIQRICRSGRDGRGLATTFIASNTDRSFLLELKNYLEASNQHVPEDLHSIQDLEEVEITREGLCSYCHITGHQKIFCPQQQIDRLASLMPRVEFAYIRWLNQERHPRRLSN